MNLQMFLVLVVTVIVFFGFVRERHSPDATAFLGVSLLLVIGALSPGDFLGVFSNSAPITIAAMFVLSKALENTGVIAGLGEFAARVVGGSWLQAMLVLLLPVMFLWPLMNSTAARVSGSDRGYSPAPGWRWTRSQLRGKFRFMSIPPMPSSLMVPSPSSSIPSRRTE